MIQNDSYLGLTNINKTNALQNYQSFNYFKPQATKKKKIALNSLYSNFSLFNNNLNNLNDKKYPENNNEILSNHYLNRDFYVKNANKLLGQYNNQKMEKDIDMMRMQLRCDLIAQKINQIQDQVQSLHDSSIKDDINLFNKRRNNNTYDNIYDISNNLENIKSFSNINIYNNPVKNYNNSNNKKGKKKYLNNNVNNKYINRTVYLGENHYNILENDLMKKTL